MSNCVRLLKTILLMKPLLLLTFLAACTHLGAQSFDREELDNYFDSLAYHNRAMGSIAISQNGEEVYTRSIGFADGGMDEPATPDHVYRVGSITKTFTTVIIHQLAAASKLSLDDKLIEYFPTVPGADQITLDQMLRHRSGIASYTDSEEFMDWVSEDKSQDELLTVITAAEPEFKPGESYKYSNSNYLLLGYIAERVSGENYAELLRSYVTEPAELKTTYVGGPINPARREVVSFQRSATRWEVADTWSMSNAGAAGNLSSTTADINKFYRALLNGELTSPEALQDIKAVQEGYGQGIMTFPFGDQTAYGHTGGIEGFSAISGYFPAEDLAITYLGNGTDVSTNDIALAALTIYHGAPFEIPNLRPVPDLPLSEMEPLVGTYGSDGFPLDIKIFIEKGKMYAQATGQGPFPLTPGEKDIFVFSGAGIELTFDREAGTMRLLQGAYDILMQRQ